MHLRRILVVEDSDEDFETVQDAARRGGVLHPIVRAGSGGECLQLLQLWRERSDGQHGRDALMLLDLNTPGDDGRDVLRHVRGDVVLGTLPVVVFSASANPHDLQFCYAHGANAFHVKPVAHAQHLQVLQAIFDYWLDSVELPA
jgi:two-component system, response regulator